MSSTEFEQIGFQWNDVLLPKIKSVVWRSLKAF